MVRGWFARGRHFHIVSLIEFTRCCHHQRRNALFPQLQRCCVPQCLDVRKCKSQLRSFRIRLRPKRSPNLTKRQSHAMSHRRPEANPRGRNSVCINDLYQISDVQRGAGSSWSTRARGREPRTRTPRGRDAGQAGSLFSRPVISAEAIENEYQ